MVSRLPVFETIQPFLPALPNGLARESAASWLFHGKAGGDESKLLVPERFEQIHELLSDRA
jgi:hypothetical protein